MTELKKIPLPVLTVVSDVLSDHYTMPELESIFLSNGAPKLYENSKVKTCRAWFNAVNNDKNINPFHFLGTVISDFMEHEVKIEDMQFNAELKYTLENKDRIHKILQKYDLAYQTNLGVVSNLVSVSVPHLQEALKENDALAFIRRQLEVAMDSVNSNPFGTLTNACSIVESVLKIHLEQNKIELPEKQTIRSLWKLVQKDLKLTPENIVNKEEYSANEGLLEILTGLASIINGLGSLRSNAGDAHGRGLKRYKVESRHAKLSLNSAATICAFIIEVIQKRQEERNCG